MERLAARFNQCADRALSRVDEDDPSRPTGDSTMVAAFDLDGISFRASPRAMEEMFEYRKDTNETRNMIGSDSAQAAALILRVDAISDVGGQTGARVPPRRTETKRD
ncbi:MAG: hypothetical protein U0163_04165 [Gemmatimonadaceae bacterium]